MPDPHFRQKLCELFGKSATDLGLVSAEVLQIAEQPPASTFPSFWHMPARRNLFFTGREEVLMRLYGLLHQEKTAWLTQSYALSGLGGIGKTQTAIEYAYRFRSEYRAVLWIRAETHDLLIADVGTITTLLQLGNPDEQDQGLLLARLKRWLEAHNNWLLMLDNVEDPAVVQDLLPAERHGHLLLTTRSQALGTLAQRIDLECMQSEEATLFLLRRAHLLAPGATLEGITEAQRTLVSTLVNLVDGLPLALDQAGAYIEETGCSLNTYLDRYQHHRATLLNRRGQTDVGHPHSVSTTFSLLFEKVEQAHPAAAELLRLCAFLHPDAIPEEIITQGAPELGEVLVPIATDPMQLDAALAVLRSFSLVRRNPEEKTLTMHRLVQAVLKETLDEPMQRQWAHRVMRVIDHMFLDIDADDVTSWPQRQRYLPQVDTCASLIEHYHLLFPEAGHLLHRAGRYTYRRGQYQQAEAYLQRAHMIYEQVLGPEHPETSETLVNLADLYRTQGKYEEAEQLLLRALTFCEQVLGPQHQLTIKALSNLAFLYSTQSKCEKAEPIYQRALTLCEQVLGPRHPDTVAILYSLAFFYYAQRRYEEAEPLLLRALPLSEQVLGPQHPYTALLLNCQATLYGSQGRYEEAELLCQRALTICEQVLGPEHVDTALVLSSQASIYYAQGRYGEAELLCQRAFTVYEQVLGPEHVDTALALNNQASVYYAQGRYEEAELLYQHALAKLEPMHPKTISVLQRYARLLYAVKRDAEAVLLLERAKAIQEQHEQQHLPE